MESKARILVVDDRERTVRAIQRILRKEGYEVLTAFDGVTGLKKICEEKPDLIILDVMMPGMNGYEVCHRLQRDPATARIPVLMLTGKGRLDYEGTGFRVRVQEQVDGYDAGAIEFLTKPIGAGRLDHPVDTGATGEVGVLARAFNEMIRELQASQKQLEAYSKGLEVLVQERTADLAQANESLQAEIAERRQAEAEARRLNEGLEQRVIERTTELRAANKELETFAYSVAHELRSPLRSVDGFSLAILEDYGDGMDAQCKDYFGRIRAASQRMARLIDDLLCLSHITRCEIQREMIDLSALAREIATKLQARQPERQVEFVIEEGLVADGDVVLLRVVLENLLDNAWKFTARHPRARIEFGVAQHDGEMAYFVRDDGAGFDMAYVDKLFGIFQRLHAMTEFEGTGTGLVTVQRIIHRHGGQVWTEGAVEQGATFYFTL